MLKTSIISLGLIIAGTTFAAAQTYYAPSNTDPDFYGPAPMMQEGRSVYVEPEAPVIVEPGFFDPGYRMRSFSHQTQREQNESNPPAK